MKRDVLMMVAVVTTIGWRHVGGWGVGMVWALSVQAWVWSEIVGSSRHFLSPWVVLWLGMTCNHLAFLSNGGKMPVAEPYFQLVADSSVIHRLSQPNDALPWLTDTCWPWGQSVGDMLMALAAVLMGVLALIPHRGAAS